MEKTGEIAPMMNPADYRPDGCENETRILENAILRKRKIAPDYREMPRMPSPLPGRIQGRGTAKVGILLTCGYLLLDLASHSPYHRLMFTEIRR